MKNILAVFVVLFLFASCAADAPPPVRQEVDMAPKINLDVLTVTVIDRSDPLMAGNSPYATNNFQPTIVNAMRQWATSKLIAVGATGEAIVVIRDASLKSEALHRTDDWFTREQASKYTGHAEFEIDVSGREGHGQVIADASYFDTLPEDPTVPERQNAYMTLLNALMRDLDANVRAGIRDHLAPFVITAPLAP